MWAEERAILVQIVALALQHWHSTPPSNVVILVDWSFHYLDCCPEDSSSTAQRLSPREKGRHVNSTNCIWGHKTRSRCCLCSRACWALRLWTSTNCWGGRDTLVGWFAYDGSWDQFPSLLIKSLLIVTKSLLGVLVLHLKKDTGRIPLWRFFTFAFGSMSCPSPKSSTILVANVGKCRLWELTIKWMPSDWDCAGQSISSSPLPFPQRVLLHYVYRIHWHNFDQNRQQRESVGEHPPPPWFFLVTTAVVTMALW